MRALGLVLVLAAAGCAQHYPSAAYTPPVSRAADARCSYEAAAGAAPYYRSHRVLNLDQSINQQYLYNLCIRAAMSQEASAPSSGSSLSCTIRDGKVVEPAPTWCQASAAASP